MENLWFDGRYINPSNPDGISRFSIGLITELAKITQLSVLICSDDQLALMPSGVRTLKANDPTSVVEILLARRLRKQGISVLFSPMQTTSSLGRNFQANFDTSRFDLLPPPDTARTLQPCDKDHLAAIPPKLLAATSAAQSCRCSGDRV